MGKYQNLVKETCFNFVTSTPGSINKLERSSLAAAVGVTIVLDIVCLYRFLVPRKVDLKI